MKKVIIGMLAGVFMLVVGILVGEVFHRLFPSLQLEYENKQLFRPWSDPLMSVYYFVPLVSGVILAWIWGYVKEFIVADSIVKKGLCFAFIYWITTIPGMMMSYSSFPLSFIIVFSWTVANLFQAIGAGLIFAKMLKSDS